MDIPQAPEEKLQHLGIVDNSVKRLRSLNSGLAEMLAVRRSIYNCSSIQLGEVLKKVMHDMLLEIKHKKACIESQLAEVPAFNYNAYFAYHILKVVLCNAIWYAKEGEAPEVSVTGYNEKDYTVLVVADQGVGIDLDRCQHDLFRPFSRSTDLGKGNGVGLYIVKSLLEHNGGSIRLESTPDEGTTVYCYFKACAWKSDLAQAGCRL